MNTIFSVGNLEPTARVTWVTSEFHLVTLKKKFYITPFWSIPYVCNVRPKNFTPHLSFQQVTRSWSCCSHVTRGTIHGGGPHFQPYPQCVSVTRNDLVCARNPTFTCILLYSPYSLCYLFIILTQLIILYINFVIKCYNLTVGTT